MYNANKSFNSHFVVISFLLFVLTVLISSVSAVDLPFDPNAYTFLVYDPEGDPASIRAAMEHILGRPLDNQSEIRTSSNPVTATDLATHDILIIGSTADGDFSGLDATTLSTGITGRVLLSGHDADWHSVNDSKLYVRQAAEKFLVNAINYALHGGGTGIIVLGEVFYLEEAPFPYFPDAWGISSQYIIPWGDDVTNFTSEALASGVYDNLDPCDMSDWGGTYHDIFTIATGSPFVPFEFGGVNNGDTITIAQIAICPSPFTLAKTDNSPADGVKPNDRLTYTIYYRYPGTNPNYTESISNIIITDCLPAEVDFFSASTGYSYNPSTRTVMWTLDSLAPGDSGLTRGLEGLPDGVSCLPEGLSKFDMRLSISIMRT